MSKTASVQEPTRKETLKDRLEIKLPTKEVCQLERIAESLQINKTEVVRYAIALFDWVVRESLAGRTFGTFDAQAKIAKEVVIPGLTAHMEDQGQNAPHNS
jgi:hypothetical protein